MWKDLQYAIRVLGKNPGFTTVAVLTLALGIGANSAVFSVFDQVILQLLPVESPRELVLLEIEGPQVRGMSSSDNHSTVFSYPQYLDYKERSGVFSGVIARAPAPVVFAHGGEGERVAGEIVSGNFFEVLGVKVHRGRLFAQQDDHLEGGHPVVVISHEFWNRRFGGRDDILDQKITVNGQPMTVIGVVSPEFRGILSGRSPELYVTLAMRKQMLPHFYQLSGHPEREIRYMNLMARLAPGISAEQANAAMQPIFRGILEDELAEFGTKVRNREEYLGRTFHLTPALQGIHMLRARLEKPLLSLMALVALVLLIACVNVAGLLMARALARSREIAVRRALGAGRGAIVRQGMLESDLLGVAGGVAGLIVGGWTLNLLNALVGTDEGGLAAILRTRVLLFNFGLALVTSLLFGLAPALQATRTQLAVTLKDQTAGAGEARRHMLFRRGTVVVQVALSMLLLVAAGLFARTLYNLVIFDPGFRTENLLSFRIDPSLNGYEPERGRILYGELQRRLGRLAGVRNVGATSLPVLGNSRMGSGLTVEGYQAQDSERVGTARNIVGPNYFRTLGIPVVLGREFEERDLTGSSKVAVVNEAFVRRYFKDENPLGRKLTFSSGKSAKPDMEIVGVVKDQKVASLREEIKHMVYTPYTQQEVLPAMTFYLLSGRDEASLGPEARRIVRDMDPHLPIFEMQTVAKVKEEAMELEHTVALLASAFAVIATLLASVGLYGLMAYGVARRTREIGVRVALGAQRGHVFGIVVKEAVLYLVLGLGIGTPLAFGLGHFLESQLFGITAHDPLVIGTAAFVLAVAVLAAALVPARRAAAVDPVVALRYE